MTVTRLGELRAARGRVVPLPLVGVLVIGGEPAGLSAQSYRRTERLLWGRPGTPPTLSAALGALLSSPAQMLLLLEDAPPLAPQALGEQVAASEEAPGAVIVSAGMALLPRLTVRRALAASTEPPTGVADVLAALGPEQLRISLPE